MLLKGTQKHGGVSHKRYPSLDTHAAHKDPFPAHATAGFVGLRTLETVRVNVDHHGSTGISKSSSALWDCRSICRGTSTRLSVELSTAAERVGARCNDLRRSFSIRVGHDSVGPER